MYINTETSEKLSHSALQNLLNTSFHQSSPPEGWDIYVSPPAAIDINAVRSSAISTINQHYQSIADAEAGKYPDFETASWPDQVSDALAYQAWDGQGETPYMAVLPGIAATRGLSLDELAGRVIANRTAWRSLAPGLIGERQAKVDVVEAVVKAAADGAIDEPSAVDEINQVLSSLSG